MLRVEFTVIFKEALATEASDLSLAPALMESKFFIIRSPADQELLFSTAQHLEEFLRAAVLEMISFDKLRFEIWATEAYEFIEKNVRHPSFVDMFSRHLQYVELLQSIIQVNEAGGFLNEYFQSIQIKSAYTSHVLPGDFLDYIADAAKAAVETALRQLAMELYQQRAEFTLSKTRNSKTEAVRKLPSFKDRRGTVPFLESDGRFKIEPANEAKKLSLYRPVIERALNHLVEANTLRRIHNQDPKLAVLLQEYGTMARLDARDVSVPLLWSCGLDLSAKIEQSRNETDPDERLEDEIILDLDRLMVAHNVFLHCFDQTNSLLEDVEASANIYERLGTASRALAPIVLKAAAADLNLVEKRSADILSRASEDTNQRSDQKGRATLRIGLLRGLLQATSGHVLNGIEKVAEKTAVDAVSRPLIESLEKSGVYSSSIDFLQRNAHNLIALSHSMPVYFGYVKNLLGLLGLGS